MNTKNKNGRGYFAAKTLRSENILQFQKMDEILEFIEMNDIHSIFTTKNGDETVTYFTVLHEGCLLQKESEGYATLEDFRIAAHSNFPDAVTYYRALAAGFSNYEEFKYMEEAGIPDKQFYDDIKQRGYIEGLKNIPAANGQLFTLPAFDNAHELYLFATKNGFENFNDFSNALQKGFTDASLFAAAKELNYNNAHDFEEGTKLGFTLGKDYYYALERNIRDAEDLKKYIELECAKVNGHTHDERVLFILLSKLPQNKKVSINKISDLFAQALSEYMYKENGEMPAWFTSSLHEKDAMINFLQHDDHVKDYGVYDTDGEYFETLKLEKRKIVIDGSNVAHNSQVNGKSKPSVSNILLVIDELQRRGFTEITVITDASLKYRLTDASKLPDLKAKTNYLEAPAENPADIFIITYVKKRRCLLLSNDTFREWKLKDPWIADNIDFYRIAFMIKENTVLLPDLD